MASPQQQLSSTIEDNSSEGIDPRNQFHNFSREERDAILNALPTFSDAIASHAQNIVPRREGRSLEALSMVYNVTPAEREQALKEGHIHHRRQLRRIDDEDDPLQIHIDYINWIIQMYPEITASSTPLRELIEDTALRFVDDPRYTNDSRYLKIWLEYADVANYPAEVYKFLLDRNIGQKLALLYEHYADYHESIGNYEMANQIYVFGIEEQAVPLQRLKKSHMLFKLKLNERIKRGEITKCREKPNPFGPVRHGSTSPSERLSSRGPTPEPMPLIDVDRSDYLFSKDDAADANRMLRTHSDNSSHAITATSTPASTSKHQSLAQDTYVKLFQQSELNHFKPENNPTVVPLVRPSHNRNASTSSRSTQRVSLSHRESPLDDSLQQPSKRSKTIKEAQQAKGKIVNVREMKAQKENKVKLHHRFTALRPKLLARYERGVFKEYIHVTAADHKEDTSFAEVRAKQSGELLPYCSEKGEVLATSELPAVTEEVVAREEEQLTEETKWAMREVNAIVTANAEQYVTPGEEDLTWERPYQTLPRVPTPPRLENYRE